MSTPRNGWYVNNNSTAFASNLPTSYATHTAMADNAVSTDLLHGITLVSGPLAVGGKEVQLATNSSNAQTGHIDGTLQLSSGRYSLEAELQLYQASSGTNTYTITGQWYGGTHAQVASTTLVDANSISAVAVGPQGQCSLPGVASALTMLRVTAGVEVFDTFDASYNVLGSVGANFYVASNASAAYAAAVSASNGGFDYLYGNGKPTNFFVLALKAGTGCSIVPAQIRVSATRIGD